jgi:LCP family protein required for cell wall assembly
VSAPAGTPARRSAFAAAFLSLLVPGLGQAYAGSALRGLVLAAPFVLLVALAGGLLMDPGTRKSLGFALLDTDVLLAVLVVDVLLLLYRVVAIVDAYRVTATRNAWQRPRQGGPGLGRPRLHLHPLSVAGLLAVLLVASGVHVAVAYYDLTVYDFLRTVTGGQPGASPSPSPTAGPTGTPGPTASPVALDERVNILLLGVDRRPSDRTFNTDTMIVVSIDPKTQQIAMLSLPRDVVDVPIPKAWPAYAYYGGKYPNKINSLWSRATGSPSLFPFPDGTRGPEALKGILGNLYGLEIPWYVEVDFDGFRRVVDTLGGVTVRADLPVQDDHYPQEFGRGATRLYIPATIQHMTGDQALAFARSRHGSNDFDRASRQQSVILALRQQADVPTVVGRLPELLATLKDAIHTDIPTSMLPQLASLADQVGFDHVRSLVFSPRRFGRENANDPRGYVIIPNVTAIRQAVKDVFSVDPDLEASQEAIADEGATVRILNGSGVSGQATTIREYLIYRGFDATVPTTNGGLADRQDYPATVITAYNGAATDFPVSRALLEELFKVTVVTKTDANVAVDFVVITGASTPKLTVPT